MARIHSKNPLCAWDPASSSGQHATGRMPFSDHEKGLEQAMERAGIEPATSGLQILSGAGQAWSSRVDVRCLRDWELSHASRGTDDGHPDLTQI
jgi:hypothetical protein